MGVVQHGEPFNLYCIELNGLSWRSTLKILLEQGLAWGYFPDLDKSMFILDTPAQEEASWRVFLPEGLYLILVSGSRYLGGFLG